MSKYVTGCMTLKQQKSQGKAVQVAVNNKAENSKDFCLDFVEEFGLRKTFSIDSCSVALQLNIIMFNLNLCYIGLTSGRKDQQIIAESNVAELATIK